MSCDHIVGLVHWTGEDELLRESEREKAGQVLLEANRRWLAAGGGVPSVVARVKAENTPAKALAGSMQEFAFCPACGVKLADVGGG